MELRQIQGGSNREVRVWCYVIRTFWNSKPCHRNDGYHLYVVRYTQPYTPHSTQHFMFSSVESDILNGLQLHRLCLLATALSFIHNHSKYKIGLGQHTNQPWRFTCSFILSGTLSVIGVLIKPGRTALQRIPKLQVHKHMIERHSV